VAITRVSGVTPAHSHVFPGGTTRTITAAGAIAVGDLLIVGGGAGQDAAAITAVTDDLGNTYTRHSLGAGSRTAWIAYCISGFAGTPVVSATKAAAGGWSFGFAAFSGATVTGVVDGGGASGSSTTGSDGITTTSAGSLVIGAYTDESTNTTAITETYGTLISEYQNGGDTWRGSLIFSIEASTGTYTPSWTLATSSPWAVYTLAFASAAGAAVLAPVSTHSYLGRAPQVRAQVKPAQVAHTYTARTPQVRARVQPGAVVHTYTPRAPQVRASVKPAQVTHTYTGRTPNITTGAAVLAPVPTHSYLGRAPQVRAQIKPPQVAHVYTSATPAMVRTIRPAQVAHTYTARSPQVMARVQPGAVVHTYTPRVPASSSGGTLAIYGWGARNKIGSASASDRWQRIGSETAIVGK